MGYGYCLSSFLSCPWERALVPRNFISCQLFSIGGIGSITASASAIPSTTWERGMALLFMAPSSHKSGGGGSLGNARGRALLKKLGYLSPASQGWFWSGAQWRPLVRFAHPDNELSGLPRMWQRRVTVAVPPLRHPERRRTDHFLYSQWSTELKRRTYIASGSGRSSQPGFIFSTRAIFLARDQPFSCFHARWRIRYREKIRSK